MNCPVCGTNTRVVDSRTAEDGESIRRRRECCAVACGTRFTTYERLEQRLLVVTKRDGRRQAYDRAKLLAGLELACTKRPIDSQRLVAVVEAIEQELRRQVDSALTTEHLSELVLQHLRELDEVAYLRFASVNRRFDRAADFRRAAAAIERPAP
ncbi:MAG: transcriptional repressor NrdR [Fimbriimonadaceae bacterium]|nr:transcriptional repressor NrdR [Fimbriimonadaceae bacterium]